MHGNPLTRLHGLRQHRFDVNVRSKRPKVNRNLTCDRHKAVKRRVGVYLAELHLNRGRVTVNSFREIVLRTPANAK